MERNEKISFGILFVLAMYQRKKLLELRKAHQVTFVVLEGVVDREYQTMIDEKFAEMTENFEW